MKKYLIIISAIAVFIIGNTSFADTKIAVLDFNKVLMSSPQLEEAKKDLKNRFDSRGKELEAAQKKFQNDVQEFSKNSPTMKADDKKTAEQKLKDTQQKLQDMQTKFQNDLGMAQNSAMQKIMKRIEAKVNQIAADQKLDVIISKATVAYNKPELDITDEVVKQIKK